MKNDMMRDETVKHLENIFKMIGEIEARNPKALKSYTSMRNEDYCECPVGYSDDMSRAMASDMFYFQMMLSATYPELSNKIKGWMVRMSNLNYRLLRMMDDDAGDRPMRPWKFKKTLKFAEQIHTVMAMATELNKKKSDNLLDNFLEKCKIWVIRILDMNTWAYYLENMENIEQTMKDIQIEIFDNDGNKISGLDDEKKKLVTIICEIRRQLTELLIETPVNTTDYKYVMDKLDLFNRMCQEITN